MVVSFDDNEKNAKLSLRQTEILARLNDVVNDISANCPEEYVPGSSYRQFNHSFLSVVMPKFHPEYGRYMLESTPGAPYTGSIPDLLSVEKNMRYRLVQVPAGLSSTTRRLT